MSKEMEQAGTTEKNDVLVKVELRDSGGLKISADTKAKEIIEAITDELRLPNVFVEIQNNEAPDWVFRARVEAAMRRTKFFGLPDIVPFRIPKEETKKKNLPTSKLFVPGNNPRRILKPTTLEGKNRPGGVILDLKNSVLEEDKDAARTLVRNALLAVDFGNMETIVRINPFNDRGHEDLKEVIQAAPYAIFIPRCEEVEDILEVEERIVDLERAYGLKSRIYLIAGIQTAKGVMEAYNIAQASNRLIGLSFGAEELTEDLGIKRSENEEEILIDRQIVIRVARAAGIEAEDTPYPNFKDEEGLKTSTLRSKNLGFSGRKAIHPAQIPIIREIFEKPSEKEVEWAKRAITAFEETKKKGQGTTSLDGKLVDRPIVEKAEKILAKAKKWEK